MELSPQQGDRGTHREMSVPFAAQAAAAAFSPVAVEAAGRGDHQGWGADNAL